MVKKEEVCYRWINIIMVNLHFQRQVPKFEIRGYLDSTCCCITQPFTGEVHHITSDYTLRYLLSVCFHYSQKEGVILQLDIKFRT